MRGSGKHWESKAVAIGLFAATACLAAGAAAATHTSTTPVPAGTQKFATLACPAGGHVKSFGVRGQFAQYGEHESDLPVELAMANPSHVIAGARGTAPSHDGSFDTTAVCGRTPALSESSKDINMAPGKQKAVKAKCPRGSSVRLGGFRQTIGTPGVDGPFVMINGLERTSSRTWKVAGVNLSTFSGRLSSFAYCGDSPGHLHAVEKTRSLQSRHYGTVTAKCARGSRFVMGGLRVQHYADSFGDIYVTAVEPSGHRGWSVTGFKYAPLVGRLTAIAYCHD